MPVPRMWSEDYLEHLFRTHSYVLSSAHAGSVSHSLEGARPFVEFTPNIHQRKKPHHYRYIFRWWHLTSTSSRPVTLPFWWITSYLHSSGLPMVKVLSIHSAQNFLLLWRIRRYASICFDFNRSCKITSSSQFLPSVPVFFPVTLQIIQTVLYKLSPAIFIAGSCCHTLS